MRDCQSAFPGRADGLTWGKGGVVEDILCTHAMCGKGGTAADSPASEPVSSCAGQCCCCCLPKATMVKKLEQEGRELSGHFAFSLFKPGCSPTEGRS